MYSYEKITAEAEKQIRVYNALRSDHEADDAKTYYWFTAQGVFILWAKLTAGSQKKEDYERLEKLSGFLGFAKHEEDGEDLIDLYLATARSRRRQVDDWNKPI